ncbi:hypothetical protein [Pseudocitrobacter sp. 73]|uniref:hypothetical protein n=1 Tax=Pseudocitrobacter sp. 73 TaxID=2605731 RepID=UPI0011EBACF4|nr:hypothetical protein [Pseudocitrobacter sp. 73]KAA1046996.1 hypothetical protein F0Q32_18830 [Pseudocitrobacter sp. 73]
MMKAKIVIPAALLAALFCQPALAISEAYRAQLERSGCTQVSEANGTCDVNASHHHNHKVKLSANDVAYQLDSHIAGKYEGQAVDYMQTQGWQPANDEQTRWIKNGFVVDFDMTSSGRLAGVVVR